jgi:hypothetical protein
MVDCAEEQDELVHFLLPFLPDRVLYYKRGEMKTISLVLLIGIAMISCRKDAKSDDLTSHITLKRSVTEYFDMISANGSGDPFELKDFSVDGDSAFITVSYSGGCQRHTFEIIWSETYYKTNPPETGLIVIHDAHGDRCEAYITETLAFNLKELFGPTTYDNVVINALNGKTPADSVTIGGWEPPAGNQNQVIFPQGDECQVEVTAGTVVCGAGLFDNLWLALNDSISSGAGGIYFKKWLQPVALSEEVKNFRPEPGKKYLIGARIQETHPFLDVIVCLAYSGPSVPIRITCVTEL